MKMLLKGLNKYLLGAVFGLSALGIYISNFFSYLTDKPDACVNCHIMTPHYASWFHSSHRNVTTCNDCHVPHDNVFRSYWFKMNDGLRHAFVFTVGNYPQVIRIRDEGSKVVMENCSRCHSHQIQFVSLNNEFTKDTKNQSQIFCWDCHREVPHGNVTSQGSTPYARTPRISPIIKSLIK